MMPVLILFLLQALVAPTVSVFTVCTHPWRTETTSPVGGPSTESEGMRCNPKLPLGGQCLQSINPSCDFNYKSFSYRCCGDLASPLNNGFDKPKCPDGKLSVNLNGVVLCNTTSIFETCPPTYKCTIAANAQRSSQDKNVFDLTVGAGKNPHLCCKMSMSNAVAAMNVFEEEGLTPSVVPQAPSEVLDSVHFGSRAVGLADDWSAMSDMLAAPPASLSLHSELIPGHYYHVLMFDAFTNKDVLIFIVNIVGMENNRKSLVIPVPPFTTEPRPTAVHVVYDKNAEGEYVFSDKYVAPKHYKKPHRFIVLVFKTTAEIPLAISANDTDTTKLNLLPSSEPGERTDFSPKTPTGMGHGAFTTVTEFLRGEKARLILGKPIAGTFFYLKT